MALAHPIAHEGQTKTGRLRLREWLEAQKQRRRGRRLVGLAASIENLPNTAVGAPDFIEGDDRSDLLTTFNVRPGSEMSIHTTRHEGVVHAHHNISPSTVTADQLRSLKLFCSRMGAAALITEERTILTQPMPI